MAVSNEENGAKVDGNIQNVLNLLVARSRGEVTNNEVEEAVSQLIAGANNTSDSSKTKTHNVVQDDDDYDNIETVSEIVEKESEGDGSGGLWSGSIIKMEDLRKQTQEGKDPFSFPLGKDGKKMLVAFGDGPNPRPSVVQAALLGARSLLQKAIKDARAWRRYIKGEYAEAKRIANMANKKRKLKASKVIKGPDETDPSLLFRATAKNDKLAYNPKCGFDVEQLQQLFPEEINAYNRWQQMHEEYVSSKDNPDDASLSVKDDKSDKEQRGVGGHLEERAMNFDIRTDEMKNEWYLKFSDFRQGSFLPRRTQVEKKEDKEWDATHRGTGSQGRQKDGNWNRHSPMSIRFLHWVGFDPNSALPPPNEETTNVLAYLGHDFVGRIVETAIQLRIGSSGRPESENAAPVRSVLELPVGEQLDLEDIIRALNDSSIKPASLYSSDKTSQCSTATQLYFGPGFERRLEMELDE